MQNGKKHISSFLVLVLLLVSCAKEPVAPENGSTVFLTIKASLPETGPDPGSKLSMNPSESLKMAWDGGETLYVMAGKLEGETLTQKVFTITGGTGAKLGVFSGELDFSGSGLDISDVKGVALSYREPSLEYKSGAIRIVAGGNQNITQSANDVFDGTRTIAWAPISVSNTIDNGGTCSISDVRLRYARPLLRLNVYDSSGKYAGLKLKSVVLYASYIHGNTVIDLGNGAVSSTGSTYNHMGTTLSGDDFTVPTGKDEGLKVFFPVHMPKTLKIRYATITLTDGSEDTVIYKIIDMDGLSRTFEAGKIYNLGFDLGSGNVSPTGLLYSTDGGSSWTSTLPDTAFSSLAVKGILSEEALGAVAGAVAGHGAPGGVSLDLGGCTSSTKTFPPLFGNPDEGSDNEAKLLNSIVLPLNVTALSKNCFRKSSLLTSCDLSNVKDLLVDTCAFSGCSALSSLDFSKIKTIRSFAFGDAGITEVDMTDAPAGTVVEGYAFGTSNSAWNTTLTSVRISKNVTLQPYAFFRLRYLSSVYLNSGDCKQSFAWISTANYNTTYTHYADLTVDLGPDAASTTSAFWCNANVTKLIIRDGATGLGGTMFGTCRYLKEIVCESRTEAPAINKNTFLYNSTASRCTGSLVDTSERRLYVPYGAESLYSTGNWKTVVQDQLGYTMEGVRSAKYLAARSALMQIYNATGGSSWTNNTKWDTDSDISSWYGVTADADGSVTALELGNNNLSGTLPDVFESLPDLVTLRLNDNALTGELPQSLKTLRAPGFKAYLRNTSFDVTTFKVPNNRIETVAEAFQVYPSANPDFRLHVDSETDGTAAVHPNRSVTLWSAATEGAGVDLFIIGEGYDEAENTIGGTAEYWYNVAAEAFFSIHPYGKLKKYYNVWFVWAHSPQKGISMSDNARNTLFGYITREPDSEAFSRSACYNFIKDALGRNPQEYSAVQVCVNSTHNAIGGGVEYRTNTIGYGLCQTRPASFRNLVMHETGGHAQGAILDEYTGSKTDIAGNQSRIDSSPNIDTESDPAKVKWAQFIADPRYASEDIGVYEGGFGFTNGVYRPSKVSMMSSSSKWIPWYNAPSRANIYRRVMSRAFPDSFEWDYETFVRWDLGLE